MGCHRMALTNSTRSTNKLCEALHEVARMILLRAKHLWPQRGVRESDNMVQIVPSTRGT
jgi:hypothetical protein